MSESRDFAHGARGNASKDGAILLLLLFLTLAPRLYAIDAPLLDYHSWRQTHTAMVARNFATNGYNILNPQVDQFGPKPAFVESEFPLYQYAVALIYAFTGAQDWVARAVSVAFAGGATVVLYLLVRDLAGRFPALLTGVFFSLSPFGIFFGRAVMPESAMIFFSVLSLLFVYRWLEGGRQLYYLAAIIATAAAIAVKLPSAYILLPALYLIAARFGRAALVDLRTYVFALGALLPPAVWYLYAAERSKASSVSLGLVSTMGGDRLGSLDLWLNPDFHRLVATWLVQDVTTWAGIPFVALGVGCALYWALQDDPSSATRPYELTNDNSGSVSAVGVHLRKDGRLVPFVTQTAWSREPSLARPRVARFLIVWSAAVFAYFLLAARGLIHQEYYILPAVPIASVLGGLGLAWICRLKARPYPGWEGPDAAPATTTSPTSGLYGIAAALFALTCLASTALLSLDRLAPLYAVTLPYLDTGQAVKASTLEDAAIVAVHHGQPEVLYYANRRGWQILPAEFSLARIEILRSLGADAVAVAEAVPLAGSQEMADVLRRYPALAIGPSLLVIDLNRQQGQRQLANNTAAAFGDSLQLLGYEATARPAATGKIVDITLRWKALQTIPQDLHISLRLFSAEGKLVVQSDGVPVNWFFPTTRWQTGDIVDDPYSLVVPPGNDVDRLRLELVVYDGANLRPLGVKETGQPHLDLGLVAMAGN